MCVVVTLQHDMSGLMLRRNFIDCVEGFGCAGGIPENKPDRQRVDQGEHRETTCHGFAPGGDVHAPIVEGVNGHVGGAFVRAHQPDDNGCHDLRKPCSGGG